MTSGYKINNVDTDLLYVRKDMFLEGNLWGWGLNTTGGPLGDGTNTHRSSPVQTIASGSNWKQVVGGPNGYVTASIKSDGSLWLWGYNVEGELGDGTTTARNSPVQTIAGGTNWKQVACGGRHTAAIKQDGTLWAWGMCNYGQLGDNTVVNKSSPVQVYGGGTNWKQVVGGYGHTAAIKTDGTLWAWGYNSWSQLGDNTTAHKSSPVQVSGGGTTWKQASLSYQWSAAIKTDGTVWFWGLNGVGQWGNNSTSGSAVPTQVSAWGTNVAQICANGGNTFAAVKQDGTLWTCGDNNTGELGDNTTTLKSSPVQTIAGGTNWRQVVCGRNHISALKTDGTVWSWGGNGNGQLGDNTVLSKSSPVQTVAGGTNWTRVTCGYYHTVALSNSADYDTGIPYIPFMNTPSGTLYSWGDGYGGALGNGTSGRNNVSPVPTVPSYNNWIQVSGGYSFEAAIKTDGTLWSWGYNAQGRLGQGITGGNINTPTQTVPTNLRWSQVSCNYTHMSAITISGALYGAGANSFGQLGLNNNTDSNSMAMVYTGGTGWVQTAAGYYNTFGIKVDGTLWAWGYNPNGELGDGTIASKSSPVQTIAGGTNWKQVSAYNSTAAIKTDGTLWSWGPNTNGILGDSTTTSRSSPVQTISGGSNWQQVSCGDAHMAAIKTDGTLWLWGTNTNGQIGDNTTTHRSSPVQTVSGGTTWKQVSCGRTWTIAIKTDGTLWTWGNNGATGSGGFLGDNTNASKSSPVQTIAGGTSWIYVNANMYTTIGIRAEAGGQQMYTTPGTYTWVAPAGVYSVSAVAVGAGGAGDANNPLNAGGGGALSYTNNITVVPGNSYTVTVGAGATYNSVTAGGNSSFSTFVIAGGGQSGASGSSAGGTPITAGVGNSGGAGARGATGTSGAGGGGAGGYSGAGGAGSVGSAAAGAGAGGGAGGGYGQTVGSGGGMAGGGVGLLGQGANGAAGVAGSYVTAGGKGGSNGTDATYSNGSIPGVYGGGQSGGTSAPGGSGAVRIIWPGTTRQFPSTNTWDM